MATKQIKINDRVKRSKVTGCLGYVKDIRQEATVGAQEPKNGTQMVNVLWDNGTCSYLAPEALEVVEAAK